MVASVPLVLTFVKVPAAIWYECQNRDTRESRIGGLNLLQLTRLRALQNRRNCICWGHSISRCALLIAPAGSFSKDIDEVELVRDDGLARCALALWRRK